MNRCIACDDYAATAHYEFRVTMISSNGLASRLLAELSFLVAQCRSAWPEFKRDPIGVGASLITEAVSYVKRIALAPNALAGALTATLLVISAVLSLLLLENMRRTKPNGADIETPVPVVMLNFPDATPPPEGAGVGVGSNGRVGLARGKGEGSESQPQRARGGGGGGDHNPLPTQQGKVPPPSEIPAPINPPLPHAALPVAGVNLDPALWANLPFPKYGDPRSKATAESKGSGDGGGMGTGDGQGVGEGKRNGVGPGEDGNTGGGHNTRGSGLPGGSEGGNDPRDLHRIFKQTEVTQRARVLSKPEPQYTEEARKNQITGTVILSAIFSESGGVTNIRAIRPLPGGLTEKAIAAARQIRFVPATRNGQPVSVYMQLEYNFNLY